MVGSNMYKTEYDIKAIMYPPYDWNSMNYSFVNSYKMIIYVKIFLGSEKNMFS